MLSEMCDVDPVTDVVWLCHSASMKQVHVGVSNTFVFARQHRLVIVTIIFFFFFLAQYVFTLHSCYGAIKGICEKYILFMVLMFGFVWAIDK